MRPTRIALEVWRIVVHATVEIEARWLVATVLVESLCEPEFDLS